MIPKIFKISGYLIDPTGRLEPHHIKAKMLYDCGFPLVGQHIHVQKAEIKKLDEKHPSCKRTVIWQNARSISTMNRRQ